MTAFNESFSIDAVYLKVALSCAMAAEVKSNVVAKGRVFRKLDASTINLR
jgi:hypothetical protein